MPDILEQKITKQTLHGILCVASSLTLAEALELLDALDESYVYRIVYEHRADARPMAFGTIGHDPYNLLKPCSQIGPIWFDGGPPGRKEWVSGLVCQYIADCILHAMTELDEEVVWMKIVAVVQRGAP